MLIFEQHVIIYSYMLLFVRHLFKWSGAVALVKWPAEEKNNEKIYGLK